MKLNDTFTSTGLKFFAHQEAMENLRNGKGQPIVTHVMLTDVCNHKCAFCSVQHRAGDSLSFKDVVAYIDILCKYDLKAVILSGGGNPILYKCRESGKNFNDVVDALWARGLDIGLITNGMPLREFQTKAYNNKVTDGVRESWGTVRPETLDKLAWVRISMSGLDHEEKEVFVPDHDPMKTTLGFSYVAHDTYIEPADTKHGQVSRPLDLISGDRERVADETFANRYPWLRDQMVQYAKVYKPRYLRLLPNCLQPELIKIRCEQLQVMADYINFHTNREVAFVQYKPPKAPKACYLGYVHPVLNSDGYVYPCDSCVLNESAEHQFGQSWRICHWSKVADMYEKPVHSLIGDPKAQCPGCVFTGSNELLGRVVHERLDMKKPSGLDHINFV